MKKILLPLLTFLTFNVFAQSPFITTWETTSSAESITIPTKADYTYSYSVDWGDGTTDSNVTGNASHEYSSAGFHTVSITGQFPAIYLYNSDDRSKIKTINQWGDIEWQSMERAFQYCENLVSVATDSPNLSNVESLSSMFSGATNFTGDLNNWDVSNVTDMSFMFLGTEKFNSDLDQWNTINVANMRSMFYEADIFNGDITTWNVQNVLNLSSMFYYAENFNQDISNWNTASLESMVFMFLGAKSFNQPIGNWDVSRITDMRAVFFRALNFNQDLNNWNVSSVRNMAELFNEAEKFNGNITSWDVSNVTNMQGIFKVARAFNQDISGWDISSVQNVQEMFLFAEAFNQNLSTWDVSHLTNMISMFSAARAFNGDITSWDVSNVVDMSSMFSGANAFNQDIGGWDVSSVSDMGSMFWTATVFNQDISSWDLSRVRDVSFMLAGTEAFNQDISSWDLSSAVTTRGMFLQAKVFNQDIGSWDVSNVTTMKRMFEDAVAFNGDIRNWNVGKVSDFSSMFQRATSFNQSLNNWDVSSSTNMIEMFDNATSFNGDLSSWDVSGVTNFDFMFIRASAFEQDISSWNVSSATTMNHMFQFATSFNADLSQWDASAVRSMRNMFRNAENFNQSLANWDVSNVTDFGSFFLDNTRLSVENYDATLQAWSALDNIATGVTFYASNLKYCTGETARNQLISNNSWSFYRDGKQCGNIAPLALEISNGSVLEGSSSRTLVGVLSTLDQNEVDLHSYQFVAGTGDTDNTKFLITGDQLEINEVPDFGSQSSYSIRIQSNDGYGGLATEVFSIKVVQNNSLALSDFGTKVFGDSDFTIQSTSNSPQNITYRSSDKSIATVYGNRVQIKAAGTASIYATQEEGVEFSGAEISRELVIGKSTQQISHQLPESINYQDSLVFSANNDSGLPISFTASNSSILSVYGDALADSTDITVILDPGFNAENVAWRISTEGTIIEESDPLGQFFYGISTKTIRLPNGSYNFLLYNANRAELTIKKGEETIYYLDEVETTITYNFVLDRDTEQKIAAVGSGSVDLQINSEGDQNYLPAQTIHTLSVNKLGQVIDFPNIPAKTYGDESFQLVENSSAGLPITYISSDENVATIEGNTVSIHNAGSVEITAQQIGNGFYNAANDVVRTLTVNKADQIISFPVIPRQTYGNDPFALGITTTSGLEVTYSISDESVVEIEGDIATIIGAGYANIVASQAGNANYNPVSTRNRVLTVNKASQSIDFGSLTNKTFGDAAFNLESTTSSGLEVTFSSSDESIVSISGNTATIVGAGSTSIRAHQSGNANYASVSKSQFITIEKAEQVINFETIPDKSFGDPAFEVAATTSAGLPLYFTTYRPNIISIEGSMVSIVGTGTADITAWANGNSNYKRAEQVVQTIVIGKGEQILTFEQPQNRTFGDEDFQFNVSSNSGNQLFFSSSDESVVDINGNNNASIVGAGTVEISVIAFGDNRYFTSAPVTRTLTINKADQNISFQSISDAVYGDGDIDLFAEASDVDNEVQYGSSNSEVATVTYGRLVIKGAGTTDITATIEGNDNYNDVSASQTFSVGLAPLTVTADSKVIEYGDVIPDLSYSFSGFAYSETEEDLEEGITLSTTADNTSDVGEYSINIISGADPNYEIERISSTLIISKASQTINIEAIGEQYLSEGSLEIVASTTSGLPLSYNVVGPATVSNNLLSFTGAGTVSLTVNQEGDNNYLPAEEQQVTFEIVDDTQEEQTITIESIDDQFSTVATVEVIASASSGLDLKYSVISGPATLNGNTINLSGDLGTVLIEVSQIGNEDYLPASTIISFDVIQDPCEGFAAEAAVLQNVSCNGYGNGSFEVNLTNGTAPFTFSLGSESQESGLYEKVAAGTYEITVSDANGCSAVTVVEITEPQVLEVTAETTESNNTEGNGSISLTVTGGTGNYSYDWSNGETTAIIADLSIGEYTVTITDAAGCSLTEIYTVGGVTANQDGFEMKIYPNPVVDQVQLIHGGKAQRISLIDANGKILMQKELNGTASQIDMKGLPAGIYFIRLDKGKMNRIVKE